MKNVRLPENSVKRLVTWLQFRKGEALRRERNKVEVFEGKFCGLKIFFFPKKKRQELLHVQRLIKTAILVFAYCWE